MTIVLTKVRGISGATPVWKSAGGSFGSAPGPQAVLRFLCSPRVIALLVMALLACLLVAFGAPGEAYASTILDLPTAGVVGSLATQLRDHEGTMTERREKLAEIFKAGGPDADFAKSDVLKLTGASDSKGVVEKITAINDELAVLGKKRDELASLARIEEENEKALKKKKEPHFQPPLPGSGDDREDRRERKSLGRVITGSKPYEKYLGTKSPVSEYIDDVGLDDIKAQAKTLFQTSAGWAPESTRIDRIAEAVTRPIQVTDLIPAFPTGQAAIPYMEETTRTHNAAERAEGAAYGEDAFALTEQSETVRLIGTSIPVTDEQLEDVEQVSGFLTQRLTFSCLQRFDGQILNGNGTAPNLRGVNNKSGIQTQAKGGDPTPDAFFKGMTKVRVTGRAFPNAHVMHPNDWQEIRLLRTADGIYIWGNPSEVGPERMWGARVAQSDAQAEGTGLTGDFIGHSALFEKRGILIEIGFVNANFGEGKKTMRAGLRVALIWFRASAFCQITGI